MRPRRGKVMLGAQAAEGPQRSRGPATAAAARRIVAMWAASAIRGSQRSGWRQPGRLPSHRWARGQARQHAAARGTTGPRIGIVSLWTSLGHESHSQPR